MPPFLISINILTGYFEIVNILKGCFIILAVESYKNVVMSKKQNGTQNKSRSSWGSEDDNRVQSDPNEHSSSKGGSKGGENQPVRSGGKIDSGESVIESIKEAFFDYTGKILRGLLVKSKNDRRVWEDRLQEAKDCLEWYQNLLEKCEKEISVADSQIEEVEGMISQLEKQ